MISYLGSLVQFSPAAGRAGRCRRVSLCVGSSPVFRPHWVCPAQGCLCFPPSTLLRLLAAVYGAGPALSAVPVFRSSTKVRIPLRPRFVSSPASVVQAARGLGALSLEEGPLLSASFPSAASSPGSQRLARTLPRCGTPFPSAAPARAAGRVSGSL